jgi:hypothetical protein
MPQRLAALLILLVFALLYCGQGLLPGWTLAPLDLPLDAEAWKPDPTVRVRVSNSLLSDVVVQYIPWDEAIRRHLARGEGPWVDPWAGAGSPLFANLQTAVFSPFTWPRLLGGLDGWALMALLKLLVAGLGAFWLGRELKIEPGPALVSALVFAGSGFLIVWLLAPPSAVFALLPAFAATALRAVRRATTLNLVALIALAAWATAAGHPETLLIGVIGIGLLLIVELRVEKRRWRALFAPAAAAALGFFLLAVQIVPFFFVLAAGHARVMRPEIEHPFRPWAIVAQILPGALGSPLRGELDLTGAVLHGENFNLRAGGFVGFLTLLALLVGARGLAPRLRALLALGMGALVMSWSPPGLWAIFRQLPLLKLLTLEYLVILFVLFAALAAGPALKSWAAEQRPRLGKILAAVGLLLLVGGLMPSFEAARPPLQALARSGFVELRAQGLLRQDPAVYEERLDFYLDAAGQTTRKRLAWPGACWLVAGCALAFPIRRREFWLVGAALAELVGFGFGYNPAVKQEVMAKAPEAVAIVEQLDPDNRFQVAAAFEVLPANLASFYGLRDATSYDVLNSRERIAELVPAGFDSLNHSFRPILEAAEVEALGRIGVGFVLSRHEVPGARRVGGTPPAVGVWQIDGATPRPLPANDKPRGLVAGAALSLLALIVSVVWLTGRARLRGRQD